MLVEDVHDIVISLIANHAREFFPIDLLVIDGPLGQIFLHRDVVDDVETASGLTSGIVHAVIGKILGGRRRIFCRRSLGRGRCLGEEHRKSFEIEDHTLSQGQGCLPKS